MKRGNLTTSRHPKDNDRALILHCVVTINQIMGIKHYKDIDKLLEVKRLFEQESNQVNPSIKSIRGKA